MMTTQKLPAESQFHNGTTVVRKHPDASPLRWVRAEALLQQIIDIDRRRRVGAVRTVALGVLCQQANSAMRIGAWTMEAIETAVNDLANAGTIGLEACRGEVMIRLLHAPPVPRRSFSRRRAPMPRELP